MKKVLMVGESPYGYTGNSSMLNSILQTIDTSKYKVSVLAVETQKITNPQNTFDIEIIPAKTIAKDGSVDEWGHIKLLDMLSSQGIDCLLMVGIDIWRYLRIFDKIISLRDKKGFKYIHIFPYELDDIREDWVKLINDIDTPCVYSQYGYNLLRGRVSRLRYFRPKHAYQDILKVFSEEEKKATRERLFNSIGDKLLFGFVGCNQVRKDPQKVIKAFSLFDKKYPGIAVLYLHTELENGVYDLQQYSVDCGIRKGSLFTKKESTILTPEYMVEVYNCLDCFVLCSLQEGLSWTVLEALACGVHVIASSGSAHDELVKGVGMLVPRSESAYIPILSGSGNVVHADTSACSVEDIFHRMEFFYRDVHKKHDLKLERRKRFEEWSSGVSDINEVLGKSIVSKKIRTKRNEILFMQHSAAGDLFMTTRCYKGLRERHGGIPLNVMTQYKYMDILRNNPLVQSVFSWDNSLLSRASNEYAFVYNPHGDRIAPGHWGRNCNSILSDFYWKILRVEPDDFYIEKEKLPIGLNNILLEGRPIAVINSSGGDSEFRTYKYMSDICEELKTKGYLTVHLGGAQDYPGGAELDLRGKLGYRQSATVMSMAALAVTVDSFLSHLAGALGISQVCLFGSGNAIVTRPNQLAGMLICRSIDYVTHCPGLGPCSASVRNCYAKCTSMHNPVHIMSDICKIEEYLLSGQKEPLIVFKNEEE